MIRWLVLVALASASVAAAQPVADGEIVVTAKVEQLSLTLGRDAAGRTTCGLSRSSGDVAIDEAMCRRASRCMKRGEIDRAALDICIAGQKKALVAAWLRGERS